MLTGHRRVKYPAEKHQYEVDDYTCHRDKEGSSADLVVIVDPAVATTTTVSLKV